MEELLQGIWGGVIGDMIAKFYFCGDFWAKCSIGKSGIYKLLIFACLPEDMLNTSQENCCDMIYHATQNPSKNSSIF